MSEPSEPPAGRTPIVWLLDLDGVLNFFGPKTWSTARRFTVQFGGIHYSIRYSPELIRAIQAVAKDFSIDVRLSSTWCEEPGPILARLGLPIPAAFAAGPRDDVSALKRQAALDVARSGRALIWTDDVEIPSAGAVFDELDDAGALLIRPDEQHGLAPEHLATIESWAATWRSA